MISEPQRLQYLDAMGLTAWVARYRLPNARPSEACEWPEPSSGSGAERGAEASQAVAPSERLQALLRPETSSAPASRPAPARSESEAPSRAAMPRRARALLDDMAPEGAPPPRADEASSPDSASQVQAQPSWQFDLQIACLDGRWLVVIPGQQAASATEVRLLASLFAAAGLPLEQPPSLESHLENYRWPPLKGAPLAAASHDPCQDARDGLCAFLHGRQRLGWAPWRVFVFGMDETLAALLAVEGEHSATLNLPVWQGPALGALSTSAAAKRALWPRLAAWQSFGQ
ncbi:MAG TPA: hypothetical protein VK991_11960 [Halomonas sp.]|nr:hypothetical protein [Halomonas sp.]